MKLAINGGKPIRSTRLEYGHQWIDEADIKAVSDVLRGDLIAQGPMVARFEQAVAEYCGAKFAVAVSSGTAALHLACLVAGIGQSDEVILPPLTFAATANAIIYCGGTPVFADIDPKTLNIDPNEIRKATSSMTKAIMPVDFAGLPCDTKQTSHANPDRYIIQDSCHSFGSNPQAHYDMKILSFHPVKHITTGEGGMIVTNNKDFADKARILRNQGLRKNLPNHPHWYYEIHEVGYNYRMTDFQAALGLQQLKRLGQFLIRRREIAYQYDEAFEDMPQIIRPILDVAHHAYHLYIIQLNLEQLKVDRNQIFLALDSENIGVNIHYLPLSLQPYYQKRYGYSKGDFPNAERYYQRCITLPIFPRMTDRDVLDVIEAARKVIGYYTK